MATKKTSTAKKASTTTVTLSQPSDFDQIEINRIIHLEQIPGYQLLKWERDYLKQYRAVLKKYNKDAGIVSSPNDDADTTTKETSKDEVESE